MRVDRLHFLPCLGLRLLVLGIALMGAPSLGHAQQDSKPAIGTYASAADADRAIDMAATEIVQAEERYRVEERACYRKFLTTACVDAAASRRRAALAKWRSVGVEARAWLRKDKADRRDAALAKRRSEDEIDARDRAQEVSAREAAIERKRLSSEERQRQAEQAETAGPDTRGLKSERRLPQR